MPESEGGCAAHTSVPSASFCSYGVANDVPAIATGKKQASDATSLNVRVVSAFVRPSRWASGCAQYDLAVSIHRGLEGLTIALDYDVSLYRHDEIEAAARELQATMLRMSLDPSLSLTELCSTS